MAIYEKLRGVHPRLRATQDRIDDLRRRLDDSAVSGYISGLRQSADILLERELLTEEYANAAFTQHGNYYEIGAQLEAFTSHFVLLYQLGETKYVKKMKEALLHYAGFAAWTGPSNKFRKTPWQSDLSTTRILVAFARAYDGMYDAFTEDERAILRDAMLHRAIHPLLADWMYPTTRVHALDSMGHNWWAVCTGLAGVGLCAIYDEVDGSLDILRDIMTSLRAFCDYESEPLLNKVANFDSDGMFYESCSYFNYGIGELCHFLFTWQNCFDDDGESAIPILEKVPAAYLAMVYPVSGSDKNLYTNFGDSPLKSGGLGMLPRYLLLLGYGGDNLRRYYTREGHLDALDYLYPDRLGPADDDAPLYPKTALFPGTGLAFLRSSSEEDATMLAVRCGFSWNHAHDDAGTYILFHNGSAILCDGGTTNYSAKEYKSYYCDAKAHNIVTVNGRAQWHENNYRGNKFSGTLPHYMAGGGMEYLLADATGPTADTCMRNHRSFLKLSDTLYVILDDLYTYEAASFASLLHYDGALTIAGDILTIANDRATAKVTVVSPTAYTVEERTDAGHTYAALCPVEQSRIFNMMQVISLDDSAVTETFVTDEGYGCVITSGECRYRIAYNHEADGRRMHENSHATLLGYQTDAYILCEASEAGTADSECVMLVYGSYLRKDGTPLFESLKKEFVVIE